MDDEDDFFEEDEPVEDVLAEFERAAEGGTTQRPVRGQTQWLTILGMTVGSVREKTPQPNTMNLFAA